LLAWAPYTSGADGAGDGAEYIVGDRPISVPAGRSPPRST